jgi:hypothetical protein
VLLEERVRDASAFCAAITKSAPERVRSALGPVQRALDGVGNSLARHVADWGATSRFATDGGETGAIATEDEPMHFGQDIKPLFRERDRNAMRFAFNLWSHDDVSTHADAILGRLEGRHDAMRRSMARRARRRLPPVDRRRQTRIGRRWRPPQITRRRGSRQLAVLGDERSVCTAPTLWSARWSRVPRWPVARSNRTCGAAHGSRG